MQLGFSRAIMIQDDPIELQNKETNGPQVWFQTKSVVTSQGQKKLPNRYHDCALVGSTASLNLSGQAIHIDAHETVIRVDRIPTPYAYSDLGWKSTILFQNYTHTREVARGNQGFKWDHAQFKSVIMAAPCDHFMYSALVDQTMPFAMKGIFPVGIERQIHGDLICAMRDSHGRQPTTLEFFGFIIFSQLCDSLHIYGFGPYTAPWGAEPHDYAEHVSDVAFMKEILANGVSVSNFAGGVEPDNPMYGTFKASLGDLSHVQFMPDEWHPGSGNP